MPPSQIFLFIALNKKKKKKALLWICLDVTWICALQYPFLFIFNNYLHLHQFPNTYEDPTAPMHLGFNHETAWS